MKKNELYGLVGTILLNGIVILLMMYFTLSGAKDIIKPQEEMVEIMFGDGDGGAGAANPGGSVSEPIPSETSAPASTISTPTDNNPSEEDVMSQVDESAVEVPNKPVVKKPEAKPVEKQSVEDKLKQLEDLRQREAIRLQKIEDARLAQIATDRQNKANKAAAAMSAFGRGTGGGQGNGVGSGSGSGGGKGTGGDGFGNGNGSGGTGSTPGNPLGHGAGGGNTWSLAGRSLNGSLNRPSYVGDQEGKIIVSITVDRTGTVIATGIASGTTISDENQRAECKAAARKQKFTPDSKASGNVIGTITYNFKIE